MNHITVFRLPRNDQQGSCLFASFPGEVRDRICTFVLNCYESNNPARLWNNDSSYVRPGYSAPHVADTALLRTCQRLYTENWFRPWVSATHTFYLAWAGRRPDDRQRMTVPKFQPFLNRLVAAHGDVEISHVRVFAQLCYLEPGDQLSSILRMKTFFPRKITVTVRHHDWWAWESDAQLRIGSTWVRDCRVPASLRELCVELESLQRKKDQVDQIASGMVEHWHFRRQDGTIMSAGAEGCKVSRWSGSSTWEGERWLRDETKPGTNEYYVKTVTWRPSKERTVRPRPRDLGVSRDFASITDNRSGVRVAWLRRAGIPMDLSASETLRLMQEWEARRPVEADEHESGEDEDDELEDQEHDFDEFGEEGELDSDEEGSELQTLEDSEEEQFEDEFDDE
ncbi:hypothetical protein PV04_00103 [Phialophora macrospora]|uniref:Uncharacterized protein n=1 Tax=Phialophora macrospora TaxID=1851006 RepID=A0A0D2GHU8_9EURO|nr:hypothetical protein PV04_00103 [Phialophora macrospora]